MSRLALIQCPGCMVMVWRLPEWNGGDPNHVALDLRRPATHIRHGYKPANMNDVVGTQYPRYTVLEGVPRIGYDIHLCPFPGALYACLKYLGDPCDYDYIMGVSGAAFRRFWNRDDGGNVDLSYLGDDPFRRAFDALGYEYRTIPAEKETMIKAIKESIRQGKPAISFGIIGPPEAGIVAGYDREGEVLYGWSCFQDKKDRYYEKTEWFETMDKNAGKGLIVIGRRKPTRPHDRDVLAASLEYAIDLAQRPRRAGRPEHVSGLAAYDAWADALEVDADYPPNDQKVLATRAMVHMDQVTMLEERHSAAKFLKRMAEAASDVAEQLHAAATLYDEAANEAARLWRLGHWSEPEAQKAIADAGNRREFAKHIRAARRKEAQAVEHLERALTMLKG